MTYNVSSGTLSLLYTTTTTLQQVCHIGTLTPCVEAVAWSCITVTWWSGPGGIQALSERRFEML